MNTTATRAAGDNGPGLGSVIRKSALLNSVIVITSFPVLFLAGGPKALIAILSIMVGISFLIWAATFTVYSFVSLERVFRTPLPVGKPRVPLGRGTSGLADRWLDGPL
jgi:hypothetical protein